MRAVSPSSHISVEIDLAKIAANAQVVSQQCRVPILAVIKADAYGLGIREVAAALRDHVEGFCVFSLREAQQADLWNLTGKRAISLSPSGESPEAFLAAHVQPAVSSLEQAIRLRTANPVLCVDLGMQRFACPLDQAEAVLEAGAIREIYCHATTVEQAFQLRERFGGRGLKLHAAGSSLLHEPSTYLDAVRPGIALYRDCARVSTTLVEVRRSGTPAGYSRFTVDHHGVILAGYSNGLCRSVCLINGTQRRILETGMQSAYVECGPADRVGDTVLLLGEGLSAATVGQAAGLSEHEALLRLCTSGLRTYR